MDSKGYDDGDDQPPVLSGIWNMEKKILTIDDSQTVRAIISKHLSQFSVKMLLDFVLQQEFLTSVGCIDRFDQWNADAFLDS